MYPYKIGQVVSVHHYPFMSKTEKEQISKEGTENKYPLFHDGKPRYGIVVGSGGNNVHSIPIVPTTSHKGDTEKEGYLLRDDEVRIPKHIYFKDKAGQEKELYGVIKLERIEMFGADEISAPLAEVPLRIKEEMLDRYEHIQEKNYYKNRLKRELPKHKDVMYKFKEAIVAEKLKFLTTSTGKNKFESMRYSWLTVNGIQHLGKRGQMNLYSVKLLGWEGEFTQTIATKKAPLVVAEDWKEPKQAIGWLREDVKYRGLMKNIDQIIRPDPVPHPDKYQSLEKFEKNELAKKKKKQIERER